MRRTTALLLIFAVVFIIGVPVYLGILGWIRITDPYRGYSGTEQYVTIPPGTSTADIGRRLAEAGVVPDQLTFRVAVWWTGAGTRLQAGEYRFDHALAPVDVLNRLSRGDVFTRRITFPEGLTVAEMARLYEERGFGKAADFVTAAGDPTAVRELDSAARDLEGYLFPDTYALPRTASASALVSLMTDRFKATYTAAVSGRVDNQELSVRELVTLASLIEKETSSADERPLVSAVYRNRLRVGMPMQADPTVIYALVKAGRYDGNIRREDLSVDSRYNTYRYPGLPPGPIAAPGRAALAAALAPADVPYLFFVSRNDGTHAFASSLAEHNANVRRFQVEFFRRSAGRSR
jgi:UPF0755 protein